MDESLTPWQVLSRAAEQGDQLEKTRLQAVGYADHIGALSKVFRDDGVVNLEEVNMAPCCVENPQ